MAAKVTVRQALQNVAEKPNLETDELIQLPVHELVARTLFEIANKPDASVRGALGRANKARKLILERLVGKRRAGSHPATRVQVEIEMVDLTGGELDEPSEAVQSPDGGDSGPRDPE